MPSASHSRSLTFARLSVLLMAVLLTGCSLRGRKQAAVPPPPKPAAQQPAPEPQLSIPQTSVNLPAAQSVNPGAIPPAPPVQQTTEEKADAAPDTKKPVRRAGPPAGATKPEPEPEQAPPPPAETVVVEQPPFQPILSSAEEKRLQDAIAERRRDIAGRLARAKGGRLSDHDQSLIDRINSFLRLSADAAERRDYTQADALCERAQILARELQVE